MQHLQGKIDKCYCYHDTVTRIQSGVWTNIPTQISDVYSRRPHQQAGD